MTDPRELFEELCPLLVEHPALGKVMWDSRSAAFVNFRKMLGESENVPLLIRVSRPSDIDEATLFRAWERVCALEVQATALREHGNAWRDRVGRFNELDRARLTLGSVDLLESESVVTWFFDEARIGDSVSVWIDSGGHVRTIVQGVRTTAPHPVPDWMLALPARVHHRIIGELVQTLKMPQYLAFRPGTRPPLVRVDLNAIDPVGLADRFDRCATLLARLESTFEESTRRAESMLEPQRKPDWPPFRWESEWAVFLEDGNATLLLRDMTPPERSTDKSYFNVSLDFDQTGRMTELAATTHRAVCRIPLPPAPPVEHVVHAKFGRGSVVSELEQGKVRIRFDDGAERVLQREFLRQGF